MFCKFVKSPLFDNWFDKEENLPKKSLLICSPYFKKRAFDKIFDTYQVGTNSCKISIEILIRAQLNDFIQGSSDIATLDLLARTNGIALAKVRRITNLHMKAYLIDNEKILIGSGNCTNKGLLNNKFSGNIEGGIATDDKEVISDFLEYYNSITGYAQPFDEFYQEIVDAYIEYSNKEPVNKKIFTYIEKAVRDKEKKHKYMFPELRANEEFTIDKNYKEIYLLDEKEKNDSNLSDIKVTDIPQFSNFEHGAFNFMCPTMCYKARTLYQM